MIYLKGTRIEDLTGQVFNRLVFKSFVGRKNKRTYWKCECVCGKKVILPSGDVKSGHTKSCGCYKKDNPPRTTHNKCKTPEYTVWTSMIQRCEDPNNKSYHLYGARGITIEPKLRNSFEAFLKEVGQRPSKKHSIDRIDNNKGYETGNLRWATKKEQALNTRRNLYVYYKQIRYPLCVLAKVYGIKYRTLQARIFELGWDIDKALKTPVK